MAPTVQIHYTSVFATRYFEVVDMVRRFLVLGLPKVLRAMAPNADIQLYIGMGTSLTCPLMRV